MCKPTKLRTAAVFLFVFLFSSSYLTVEAQTSSPLGDGSKYLCEYEGGFGWLVKIKPNSSHKDVAFRYHIRKAKRNRKRYSRKLRRAQRRGNEVKIRNFQNLLDEWTLLLDGMTACQAYEEDPPDDGGDDGSGDNNDDGNGGDDGGGIVGDTNACNIYEGSTVSGQVSVQIIKGNQCNIGNSAIVELYMLTSDGSSLGSCTGTAITTTAVLTAAHCLADSQYGSVGMVDVQTGSQTIRSSTFYVHSGYNNYSYDLQVHDLALVLLGQSLNTKTFPLLKQNNLQANEKVAIAGYGLTETGNTNGLRAGFMTLNSTTTESIIALYDGSTGSNTCSGDSGGPLVVKRDGTWYLAGVTSNGDNQNCGMYGGSDTSRWANVTSSSNLSFIGQHVPGAVN